MGAIRAVEKQDSKTKELRKWGNVPSVPIFSPHIFPIFSHDNCHQRYCENFCIELKVTPLWMVVVTSHFTHLPLVVWGVEFNGFWRKYQMKEYLSVRWQKRWRIIPVSIIVGVIWVARSLATHDGRAVGAVVLLACLDAVVILFPFRWGGEQL